MDFNPIVRDVASKLGLLTATGELMKLDSLALVDLVLGLEEAANVTIPPDKLTIDNFGSLETIQGLLHSLPK